MSLAENISYDFPKTVRDRGASYFHLGCVKISKASDQEVEALVFGGYPYRVKLSYTDGCFSAWCTCPYAGDQGPCKHIWATVLAADAKGYLTAAGAGPLSRAEESFDRGRAAKPARRPVLAPKPQPKPWELVLKQVHGVEARLESREPWPSRREVMYVFQPPPSPDSALIVELMTRELKSKGRGYNKPKQIRITRNQIPLLPSDADRHILTSLAGATANYYYRNSAMLGEYALDQLLEDRLVPIICATGRGFVRTGYRKEDVVPVSWEAASPLFLEMEIKAEGKDWLAQARLLQDGKEIEIEGLARVSQQGFVFIGGRVFRLENPRLCKWIEHWGKIRRLKIDNEDIDKFLAELIRRGDAPRTALPEALRYEEVSPAPRPMLQITTTRDYGWEPEQTRGELLFDYDGRRVSESDKSRGIYLAKERKFLLRDRGLESECAGRLLDLGMHSRKEQAAEAVTWRLPPSKLPQIVQALVQEGWLVEADGKTFRRPSTHRIEISSGIDWFELRGEVDYGGAKAKLPALIAALRKGHKMVRLDDGSFGMLPEQWLSKLGPLVSMGADQRDHLRFHRSQAGLLDALLAAQPETSFDEGFQRIREQLREFQGIAPSVQPSGFTGKLREYQREGLGWMQFLTRFGFGGCLADDMGVGKTIQVLALLETRREQRAAAGNGEAGPRRPSLVVVPRSLVFNWKEEAARFTPKLSVLDHTGLARNTDHFVRHDVVLTTYGTLRRDAARFQNIEFDYLILDEAQAIKNSETESAKAVRLLKGRHRLALSGTPVENHLGELWSLFEFLNPGMLGSAGVFKLAGGAMRNPDQETRQLLAHALRPFILRRTKEQVASELPAKTEQTIYCEMEAAQRKLYNELRAYYRDSLLKKVDEQGLAKSKMHVLEALLRLRQAACHPGLLDESRAHEPSAKLEVLLAQLSEVLEEGHKALVFSQFTSLLALVRERLDVRRVPYAYVDGGTTNRKAEVDRFQTDPQCPLFLLSLKAGGLGLNLTAAEYVFLLDPWWNPAVESQAIDRAHRIGQTQRVFAYRLIARDTVEEKVLELQKTKRDLAAAIMGEDNSLIRDLKREDLELLLS